MPEPTSLERGAAGGIFVVLVVLIMTFLLRDASSLASVAVYEVAGHAGASAGFTLAASGLLVTVRNASPSTGAVLLGGAVLTVLGEVGQYLNPTRFVELGDILTGFVGVTIAGLGLRVLGRLVDGSQSLRLHVGLSVAAIAALVVLPFTGRG